MAGFKWGTFGDRALDFIGNANARINIAEGAVRSAKTVSSEVRWLQAVRDLPEGNLLMVGKTERTLKRNILDDLERMVGRKHYRYDRSIGEVKLCGRTIYVAGANDESAQDKIRGLTLAGAYGDELTLWPESFYTMLLSRLSVPGAKFFGTTNPDSPYHWLKTDYIDREDELDLRVFHFELSDNPNLDPAYVAALKAEYTGLWYRRFIQGLWVVAEGAVFDMFDESLHVASPDEIPASGNYEKVIVGADYGTTNPTAFVALGLKRGIWYAFAEHRYDSKKSGRQKTDAEHAGDYREFVKRGGFVPASTEIDPSAASWKAQLKQDGVRKLHDADHAVIDGIRVVSSALTGGRLVISSECTELIKEFATYVWDPKAQKKGEDRPVKANDHQLDALRYAAMRALGRPKLQVLAKPKGA